MEISSEKKGELKDLVKVTVNKEDYEEEVNKIISDYRKKVRMNGFRPGKVPFGLVKKKYGKEVVADQINKLVTQKLSEYIRESDKNYVGDPVTSKENQPKVDYANQETFEFFFEVGYSSEIDPEKISEVTVPYYSIYPDETVINETIENHKNSLGDRVEVEQADEDDIVEGNIEELDEEGNKKEDGIEKEGALISIKLIKDEDIKEQFLGAQKEDMIAFNLRKALPNDTELASLLNKNKDEVTDLTSDFRIEITSIKRFKQAEVNQQLFDKIYGEGVINSEEEYRQRIVDNLKKDFKRESNYKFMNDVKDAIIKYYNPALPDDFLKQWLIQKDENLTGDNIDEEYNKMFERLQWEVISGRLSRYFNIKVSEDEIREYTKQLAMMQFQQYGMDTSNVPESLLDNYVDKIMEKDQERQRMEIAKREEKLALELQNHVTLDEKEISYSDYKEMMEPDEQAQETSAKTNQEPAETATKPEETPESSNETDEDAETQSGDTSSQDESEERTE